ncbi:MAG: hypothetical protein AABN34_25180 [Acidobacteriota bacterium]
MRNCQRTVSALLAIFLFSEFAFAKTNTNDWNNVRILEIGSTIVVKTKQGEKYEGTLDLVTVNSLSIVVTVPRVMRRVIDLRKDEIKEVRSKLSRFASTAIGAAIGLGVGIGLGAIADSKDKYGEDPGLGKITIGFTGVLLGSVLGGGFGFGSKKVYDAP